MRLGVGDGKRRKDEISVFECRTTLVGFCRDHFSLGILALDKDLLQVLGTYLILLSRVLPFMVRDRC